MSSRNVIIQKAMRSWQDIVCEGNTAFANCHYVAADQFYLDGLGQLAEVGNFLTSNSPPPTSWIVDQFVPALVVSYLNLVDSSMAQDKPENACDFLIEGYNVVCDCAHCLLNTEHTENHYLFSKHLAQLQHHSFSIRKHLSDNPELISKLEKLTEPYSVTNVTIH